MDSYQILTVIISILLIIILVFVIASLVLFVQVLRHVKKITEKAESMVDNVSHVGSFFTNTTATKAVVSLLGNISSHFSNSRSKKTKK